MGGGARGGTVRQASWYRSHKVLPGVPSASEEGRCSHEKVLELERIEPVSRHGGCCKLSLIRYFHEKPSAASLNTPVPSMSNSAVFLWPSSPILGMERKNIKIKTITAI